MCNKFPSGCQSYKYLGQGEIISMVSAYPLLAVSQELLYELQLLTDVTAPELGGR